MTPMIALDLSLDGIVVMSRAPSGRGGGTWQREGIVRLDDPDMAGAMQRMRAVCAARAGEDFTSILIIPDSQLLYTSFERDSRDAKTTIRALLQGRTPYPVEDLTFDFEERGDSLQVAVVARDTLEEAEAFASGFGFRPVALVGDPKDASYPGIPDFGQTRLAPRLLGGEALVLDLAEGFASVPAPTAPDNAGPPPLGPEEAMAEPEPEILPSEGMAPTDEPPMLPEDPSDFAAAMEGSARTTPMDGTAPLDVAAGGSSATKVSDEAQADGSAIPEAAPAFATRRRAPEAARTEPGITRIQLRLSQPSRDVGEAGPQTAAASAPPANRAALPSRRRFPGGAGLYLTLFLLVLLGLLALWSVAFRDDDAQGRALREAIPATADRGDVVEPEEEAGDVALADLSPDDTSDGVAESEAEEDLALLNPDIGGTAEGGEPPAEKPAEPEIAVVTIDAEPFELPRDIAAAPEADSAEDIYIASIDPVISGTDAVALPPSAVPADRFSPQTSPAPAGTAFETGSDGLVVASASGTLAPGGYSVIAGRPATVPAPRPTDATDDDASAEASDVAVRVALGRNRPVPRPEDAPERAERLSFNGLTREELTRTPPVRRPAAISEAAARAEAVATQQAAAVQAAASAAVASLAQTESPAAGAEPGTDDDDASRYALAESGRPRERPRAVEQDAARIVTQRRAQPAAAAVASAAAPRPAQAEAQSPPTIRSAGGSVSRAATQSSQIRLRDMNLIGVYGQPNARRALVRLSNGRYVKIEVGDRLERGRVTAIGESEVIYQQNGRNYALRMPQT